MPDPLSNEHRPLNPIPVYTMTITTHRQRADGSFSFDRGMNVSMPHLSCLEEVGIFPTHKVIL